MNRGTPSGQGTPPPGHTPDHPVTTVDHDGMKGTYCYPCNYWIAFEDLGSPKPSPITIHDRFVIASMIIALIVIATIIVGDAASFF